MKYLKQANSATGSGREITGPGEGGVGGNGYRDWDNKKVLEIVAMAAQHCECT